MDDTYVIVLAGGKGTRMNNETPKVLLPLLGKPIIFRILDLLIKKLMLKNIIVVVGHNGKIVKNAITNAGYIVKFAGQRAALGTANSTKAGLKFVPGSANTTIVLYGDDSGLYSPGTIKKLINVHNQDESPISILTLKSRKILNLGGIERTQAGKIMDVLSSSELEERGIKEVELLCGAFCFETKWLKENIKKIKKGKLKGEYPLPVLINYAAKQGKHAKSYTMEQDHEWNSVNTNNELKEAESKLVKSQ